MLKTLFAAERKYINSFFDAIDCNQAEKILQKLLQCKGAIVFSGVGKSGHIAEKIAATFSSTGTRSFFLSPVNALHGDLGLISASDLFFCFSKSGATKELLELLPHIQKKGAATIAAVSVSHSELARLSDLSITLPIQKELCPFDLAPTTSTVAQMIFGDCLAVALMQAKGFTISDFASNHPGGLLGRKITLKVGDLMLKESAIPLCNPADKLMDVLYELSLKRCGCLVVADEANHLKGIFTDGDLRRAIQSNGPSALQMQISDLMTFSPKSIAPHELAVVAVKRMEEDPLRLITVLPVVNEGRVVGLIRMHDILQKELG